jgi:hypothetical protein
MGLFAVASGILIACVVLWLLWWWIESSFKAWQHLDSRINLSKEEKKKLTPLMPRWLADTWKPVYFYIVYYWYSL